MGKLRSKESIEEEEKEEIEVELEVYIGVYRFESKWIAGDVCFSYGPIWYRPISYNKADGSIHVGCR